MVKFPTKQTCYPNVFGENGTLSFGWKHLGSCPLTVSNPQNPRGTNCPGFCWWRGFLGCSVPKLGLSWAYQGCCSSYDSSPSSEPAEVAYPLLVEASTSLLLEINAVAPFQDSMCPTQDLSRPFLPSMRPINRVKSQSKYQGTCRAW